MQHYAANCMLFLKHVGQAAQKIDMRYGLMVELGFTSGDYSGLNLYLIHPVYLGIKNAGKSIHRFVGLFICLL